MTVPSTGIQNLALCSVFTMFFGDVPVMYTPSPRGDCDNCCEIREPKDIKFYMFNKNHPRDGRRVYVNSEKGLRFLDRSLPLVMYIHGFTESAPGAAGQSAYEIKEALLDSGNFTVILVDWSSITALPWYSNTVQAVPRVARYIARFIKFLIKFGVPIENFHLVGFSLGAEVAGFAGKTLKESGVLLPRITGLDPAGPLFMSGDTNTHISAGDAKFVDVIHTDSGIFGIPWQVGHADFYPNNGFALQPGCISEASKNNLLGVIVSCSHSRAFMYFVESIRRPRAFECNRCETINNESKECAKDVPAFMGFYADRRLRGKFYLTTNSEPPFGRSFEI